jgi:hypothetical protein
MRKLRLDATRFAAQPTRLPHAAMDQAAIVGQHPRNLA